MVKRLFCLLLCAWGAALSPSTHGAETSAARLMSQGNAAFRQGDYDRAIEHYRRARKLDAESTQLAFNLGIAYYWSGHYADAAKALRDAAGNPKLAARAWYNMGLAHWAEGDARSARPCFEWAIRFADSRQVRALAARAIEQLDAGMPSPRQRRQTNVFEPRTGPRLVAATRVGTERNVFRAPDAPYVDLSQSGQPTITPVRRSGSFMSAQVMAASVTRSRHDNVFRRSYEFDGVFYGAAQLAAAEQQSHRITIASDAVFGPRATRRLRTDLQLTRHREISYDPDTGTERTTATGANLRNRFSYVGASTDWDIEQALGRVVAGLSVKGEYRKYDGVPAVSSYDHALASAGIWLSAPFGDRFEVRAGFNGARRDYAERRSRDAGGALLASNPALRYDYRGAYLTTRYDLGRAAWIRLRLERTKRQDRYLGYANYTRDRFSAEGAWRPMPRLRLEARVDYRDYDFPRAFAYNTPAGGRHTLSDLDALVSVRYRVWRDLHAYGAYEVTNSSSPDARYDYSWSTLPVGLQWEMRF